MMLKLPLLYKVVNSGCNFFYQKNFQPMTLVSSYITEIQPRRSFAKGKDIRKGDKGKGTNKNIQINEALLEELVDLNKIKTDMENSVLKLNENYLKFVSVRTALGAIETVKVPHDGKKYPLMELGQVIRKNPKLVTINMAAFPQALPATLKALSESGMNLNPQQDGTTIFVPVPKITREHRENLSKNAKALFIKCRDGVRDVQNKVLKTLKSKNKENISEDVIREASEQVKFIGDNYIRKAEKLFEEKQIELLGNKEEK